MVQYLVEIVTAITIFLIIAILTVYLSILKKNGWIGEPSNYRCPNPQCKKIFQSPMKVKDYSNKKVAHLACPECGYDLGSSNEEDALKQSSNENTLNMKINESSPSLTESDVLIPQKEIKEPEIEKTKSIVIGSNQGKMPQKINSNTLKEYIFESHKMVKAKNSASTPIENEVTLTQKTKVRGSTSLRIRSKENKNPQKINPEKIGVVKRDKPTGCNHFFGYLWTFSNSKNTPDECYFCSRLIECNEEATD